MQTLKGGKSAVGHGNKLRIVFYKKIFKVNVAFKQKHYKVVGELWDDTWYGDVGVEKEARIGSSYLTKNRKEAEKDSIHFQETGFFKKIKIIEVNR